MLPGLSGLLHFESIRIPIDTGISQSPSLLRTGHKIAAFYSIRNSVRFLTVINSLKLLSPSHTHTHKHNLSWQPIISLRFLFRNLCPVSRYLVSPTSEISKLFAFQRPIQNLRKQFGSPTRLDFSISNIPDLTYLPNGIPSSSCNILPRPLSYKPASLLSNSFPYFLMLYQYLLLNSSHLAPKFSRFLLLNAYPLCIPHRPERPPSLIVSHSNSCALFIKNSQFVPPFYSFLCSSITNITLSKSFSFKLAFHLYLLIF